MLYCSATAFPKKLLFHKRTNSNRNAAYLPNCISTTLPHYDYIIVGGGCAGMSLALSMAQSLPDTVRTAVVEPSAKVQNDRTWAFWTDKALPLGLDAVVSHRWKRIRFHADAVEVAAPIAPYTYNVIRGDDYYRHIQAELAKHPQVTWLRGHATAVWQDADAAYCRVGDDVLAAQYLFDSRAILPNTASLPAGQYFLWQHFKGWVVETPTPVFDASAPVLMDFRVAQGDGTAFCYLLPFSDTRALVEYTAFSATLLSEAKYAQHLTAYCERVLGLTDYQVIDTESGRIPMTNAPLHAQPGGRIHPIGTAANVVKPTTGYAFSAIHTHNAQVVAALQAGQRPPSPQVSRGRFGWYDNLLLHLLTRYPERGPAIFTALFSRVPPGRILRFLLERTSVWHEVGLFARLPIGWFLSAAVTHPLGWLRSPEAVATPHLATKKSPS